MDVKDRTLWYEGKQLWNEYVNTNGYSFTFNSKGIKRLSKILDLKQSYIKKRICIYLDN